MELPEWLGWLHWVVGADWPEGDEDAMRRMADAWRGLGTAVGTAGSDGDAAVGRILTALDSADGVRFDRAWSVYSGGGEAYLTELSEACEALAKLCEGTAEEIEYAKYTFLVMLVILAIDIIVMLALAVETLGATLVEIGVEEAITQLTIREIAGQVVERIAARAVEKAAGAGVRELALGAAKEFGKGVAPDLVAQTAMLADGHENGGWNFARTGQAVGGAAVDATVGFGADRFGETGLGSRVFADNLFGQSVKGAATGAVSGAASPLFGGELPAWQDVAQGATSGAFGGAVGYGRETVEQYRWSSPGGEHVAVPDPGTDLAAAEGSAPAPSTSDSSGSAVRVDPDGTAVHSPESADTANAAGRSATGTHDAGSVAGESAAATTGHARDDTAGTRRAASGTTESGRAGNPGEPGRRAEHTGRTGHAGTGPAGASEHGGDTRDAAGRRETGGARAGRAGAPAPDAADGRASGAAESTRIDRTAAGERHDGRASEQSRGDRTTGSADDTRSGRASGSPGETRGGHPANRVGAEPDATVRSGGNGSGHAGRPGDGAPRGPGDGAVHTGEGGTVRDRSGAGVNAVVLDGRARPGHAGRDEPAGTVPPSRGRPGRTTNLDGVDRARHVPDPPLGRTTTPGPPRPETAPTERPRPAAQPTEPSTRGADELGYDPHRPGFAEPPDGVNTVHHHGHEWVRLDDGAGWHRVDFRATDPRFAGKGFAARLKTFVHTYFPPRDGHTSEDLFKDARSKVDTEVPEGREWEFERLTEDEAKALAGIRGESRLLVPGDAEGTHRVIQKIFPGEDIDNYTEGRYSTVTGFITKLVDVVHLRSPSAIIRALRLDYEKTTFRFGQDNVYAIRMTLGERDASDRVVIPSSPRIVTTTGTDDHGPRRRAESAAAPFSGSGFSADYTDGTPELKAANPDDPRGGIPLRSGAEMWRIDRDGHEVLLAVYHFGRWHKPT